MHCHAEALSHLHHSVVGDMDGDFLYLGMVRKIFTNAGLPHETQVVVKAHYVPASSDNHHNLFAQGTDQFCALQVVRQTERAS